MKRAMPQAWHSACTSGASRRSKSSPMIDVVPPIGRNRELIDADARAAELTDCALGLEKQRLALNKIVDRRMAAEIPLAQ